MDSDQQLFKFVEQVEQEVIEESNQIDIRLIVLNFVNEGLYET